MKVRPTIYISWTVLISEETDNAYVIDPSCSNDEQEHKYFRCSSYSQQAKGTHWIKQNYQEASYNRFVKEKNRQHAVLVWTRNQEGQPKVKRAGGSMMGWFRASIGGGNLEHMAGDIHPGAGGPGAAA